MTHTVDKYTKIAINHDLEHSSITNCFLIVLYHVVQLRFDNSQYTNRLCYVMILARVDSERRDKVVEGDWNDDVRHRYSYMYNMRCTL